MNNEMAITTYLSTVTLNVNGLNAPIRRQLGEWIRKQDLYMCCLRETHFRSQDTHRLKTKGQKKLFHENETSKQNAGVAILTQDKMDFKTKARTRGKEGPVIPLLSVYPKKRYFEGTCAFMRSLQRHLQQSRYGGRLGVHSWMNG